MLRLLIGSLSLLFALCHAVMASDPSFRIADILDDSGAIKQTMVFLTDADLQKKIPKQVRALMELPPAELGLLDPCQMFTYDERGLNQNFYPAVMDQYLFIPAENQKKAEFRYLLTSDLCECVGISIYVAKTGCGLMHAGFKSLRYEVTKFLQMFPKTSRATARVVLVSGYFSEVLQTVYEKLLKEGYKNITIDVIPTYLECENQTASGIKYSSYEKLGLTKEDASRLSSLPREKIEAAVNPRIVRNPELADSHRVLITDMRDGKSYQFFRRGCGDASSQLVHLMYSTRRAIEERKIVPALHQKLMSDAILAKYNEGLLLQQLIPLKAKQYTEKVEDKK